MAPENTMQISPSWLDNNRISPSISNKNAIKFDTSKVNSKMDFMRSLDLFCIKVNWDVLLPKDSIPLKKCSVVINNVKCSHCAQSLKSQNDIEHHKKIHRQFELNNPAFPEGEIKESNCTNVLKNAIVHDNKVECNNNVKSLKNADKIDKKIMRRKKSKKTLIKVTFKIGKEIISKIYFKRKYLDKNCLNNRNSSTEHSYENCENCTEIKERLQSSKVTAKSTDISLSQETKLSNDLSSREARIRKMATLLVEQELQRKALQDLNNSRNLKKDFRELNNNDSVVPELNNEISSVNDDDIHEILRITNRNDNSGVQKISNRSDTILRNDLYSMKHIEIITIDDEFCDDSENDCIIIDELCTKNSLINEENSYIFHVTNKDIYTVDAVDLNNINNSIKKRKLVNNFTSDISKKQKLENVYAQFNTNTSRQEKEKKNHNFQISEINISQLPYL